jgi:SAM-dependent methyltransferase
MRSVKSSVRASKTVRAQLPAVAVIVLLLTGAARSQEPAPPPIDEEMAKQEKIYRSRGAEVPRGYVTDRGLMSYAELLPSGFCDALGKLGASDRWLDIGTGAGQAILDYYASDDDREQCGGSGAKARAVGVSIEDRRGDAWKQLAARLGDDRIRYLAGKRVRQYSSEDLGKFKLITDVFGGLTYTENLSLFVDKVLGLLEVGGGFYALLPGVHLENGQDRFAALDQTKLFGSMYLTELKDAAGADVKACSWLKRITCVEVSCESKSDWKRPSELINIRKVCSDVVVPPVKLLTFAAGNPPDRRFQLEQ